MEVESEDSNEGGDQDVNTETIPKPNSNTEVKADQNNNEGLGNARRNTVDVTETNDETNDHKITNKDSTVTKQHKNENDGEINKLDHEDFYYDENGIKMVRMIATE